MIGIIPACAGSTSDEHRLYARAWDHPRVRGEHRRRSATYVLSRGSSPRARGARCHSGFRHPERGIIPACAGSTSPSSGSCSPPRDHPRVRGEHAVPEVTSIPNSGSSPRARGARDPPPPGWLPTGIIPACAGSTAGRAVRGLATRDHPRVRGEHSQSVSRTSRRRGSSPRARGAPTRPAATYGVTGIIPACAGSTRERRVRRRVRRDHPRVRGEHARCPLLLSSSAGSSPRARGAPDRPDRVIDLLGIIPACAGSTGVVVRTRTLPGDHPRVRGEHRLCSATGVRFAGSSPRARGAPRPRGRQGDHRGIIPACAGSTHPCRPRRPARRDHPRVRGEHGKGARVGPDPAGSSPRARGALTLTYPGDWEVGIIPACAGSTAAAFPDATGQRDHPRVRGEHPPGRVTS